MDSDVMRNGCISQQVEVSTRSHKSNYHWQLFQETFWAKKQMFPVLWSTPIWIREHGILLKKFAFASQTILLV